MLNLIFNDVKIPNWIRVTNITEDILPNDNKKIFKVDFYFKRNKLIDTLRKQELIDFVKGNRFEESKLLLPNRNDFFYWAKAEISNIDGSIRKGQGTIEFTCTKTEQIEVLETILKIEDNLVHKVYYQADIPVYPAIKFKVKSACDKIKLIVDDTFLELNHSFNANDIIEINQETFRITVNQELKMHILHLLSKRVKLKKGENSYQLVNGNCEVEISWNNKYH
ncbi:MAG: phage distal tail protein [Sarcina sp.]